MLAQQSALPCCLNSGRAPWVCRELASVWGEHERAIMEASTVKNSAASERDRAAATTSELQARVAQLDQHATHLTDRLHAAEETAKAAATTLHAAHAAEMHKLREAHAAELQVRSRFLMVPLCSSLGLCVTAAQLLNGKSCAGVLDRHLWLWCRLTQIDVAHCNSFCGYVCERHLVGFGNY